MYIHVIWEIISITYDSVNAIHQKLILLVWRSDRVSKRCIPIRSNNTIPIKKKDTKENKHEEEKEEEDSKKKCECQRKCEPECTNIHEKKEGWLGGDEKEMKARRNSA